MISGFWRGTGLIQRSRDIVLRQEVKLGSGVPGTCHDGGSSSARHFLRSRGPGNNRLIASLMSGGKLTHLPVPLEKNENILRAK